MDLGCQRGRGEKAKQMVQEAVPWAWQNDVPEATQFRPWQWNSRPLITELCNFLHTESKAGGLDES